MSLRKLLPACLLIGLAFCGGVVDLRADEEAKPGVRVPVGVSGRLEQIVLPGPELEVRPVTDDTLLVVRIEEAYRHGSAWRYDFVFYGLEPGTYDVTKFLRTKHEAPAVELPPISVDVYSTLPASELRPHPLKVETTPMLSHYRIWIMIAVAAWFAGLVALLVLKRRASSKEAEDRSRPISIVERLRPLIGKAREGELSVAERASLERLLITFWRRRLDLGSTPAHEVMAILRDHAEAGPLMAQLETWLHSPGAEESIDVDQWLKAYETLSEDVAGGPESGVESGGAGHG